MGNLATALTKDEVELCKRLVREFGTFVGNGGTLRPNITAVVMQAYAEAKHREAQKHCVDRSAAR